MSAAVSADSAVAKSVPVMVTHEGQALGVGLEAPLSFDAFLQEVRNTFPKIKPTDTFVAVWIDSEQSTCSAPEFGRRRLICVCADGR